MTQWTEIPSETQVLIVGGGPTGLLMSILLSQQGISNVVVERKLTFQQSPAAHVVNARTFEICRSAGIDMEKIEAIAQDPADGAWVRWSSALGKGEVGKVPFEGQHHFDELFATSPYPLRNLSQHQFEPLLGLSQFLPLRLSLRLARCDSDDEVLKRILELSMQL